MKKLLFISIVALLATCLASCDKNEEIVPEQPKITDLTGRTYMAYWANYSYVTGDGYYPVYREYKFISPQKCVLNDHKLTPDGKVIENVNDTCTYDIDYPKITIVGKIGLCVNYAYYGTITSDTTFTIGEGNLLRTFYKK